MVPTHINTKIPMMIPFLTSIPYMVLKTFGLAGLAFFFFASSLLVQIDISLTKLQFWEQEKLLKRDWGCRLGA
jgi:hypothetical protein